MHGANDMALDHTHDPRARSWLASANAEGTDFHAAASGAVSITPLQVDLTHANQIPLVAGWMDK